MEYNRAYGMNQGTNQGTQTPGTQANAMPNISGDTASKTRQDSPYYEHYPDGSNKVLNFTTPPQESFDSEEMRGSMQKILSDNVGEYVVIEFLIGTERIMRKQGVLYFVGRSFVTVYDEANRNFIVCDIFSIKFVYFYLPGELPNTNYNLLPNTSR